MGNDPMGKNPIEINQMSNPMGNNPMGNNPIGNNQMSNNPMVNNQMSNNQMGNNQMSNNPMVNNQMSNNPMVNNQMSNPMGNNQNNQEQKYSFSRYQHAAKTGLKNLGDTSYLNSVLQLLATSRNLSSYFVNPKNQKEISDNVNRLPISFVIGRLFTHLYPYPERFSEIYKPEILLQVLGTTNQVYKSTKRRNPNDLLNYILCQLHKELNLNTTKFITKSDPTKKDLVIKEGMNDFGKSNNSIISNNFHWFEIKTKHCTGCNLNFYDFNNYETLELDLLGAYQKYKQMFTLNQCLEYQKQKVINSFCQKCQNYKQFNIFTNIYSSPLYFIFSLNRGDLNNPNLLNIPFQVEPNIDIYNYLENKQAFSKYELYGIVSISKAENNKYVCFGKSPVDKQWYLYNDEIVKNTNINEVINSNCGNPYIPCILLYQHN